MRTWLRYGIAILAMAMLPFAVAARMQAAEGSFDRSLKVTGPVEIEVTTGSGHIEVRTGDSSTVRVHGTIKASHDWDSASAEERVRRLEKDPPIEQSGQSGDFIRIGRIEDDHLRHNISISYELVVPRETRLRSETGSGSVSVDGVKGPVKATSGSGSLHLTNLGDELHAKTGSGDVRVESVKGDVHLETGSGSIEATGVAGNFTATTGSGRVKLEEVAAGRVEVETGSGGIEVRGVHGSLRAHTGSGGITAEGEATGEWTLHAGSGPIDVRVPSGSGFDLYAQTSSGHVTVDQPLTVQGTIRRGELRGKVGGGGVAMDLRTGSGNIHVE
ncbi:MAG TPA: DUF4097 family beta strand repeat-containing protein [Terriglobia bacterium]|nr:DUF4097 family beta strand repeat-containing protein [Terriglobia bacterium]